jgi:SAM-dependent methyltransferase
VLDIGCGVGAFLRLVAQRGGLPHGLDASESLIAFARERLPHADLRAGEMEELPWEDDSFDLVTGFNSFFFANDMVAALREAGRVAKPGAPVVIQVWGAHERCDFEAMKQIARPFLPPRQPDAPADPDLSRPRVLRGLAIEAGLSPESEFDSAWTIEYPDTETLGRALVAVAGLAVLAGPEREQELNKGPGRRRPRPLPHPRRQLPALERVPLPDRARVSRRRTVVLRHPAGGMPAGSPAVRVTAGTVVVGSPASRQPAKAPITSPGSARLSRRSRASPTAAGGARRLLTRCG